ncbi:unnamed protein product [Mycena citricolor]|uniref:Uncharacterized protein n=1 Tax=Mycena citricolor TaxID=2018698 RepID=A0AAD2H1G2_9AGAR|nr:unnamed protein product [Mycena citricolor]
MGSSASNYRLIHVMPGSEDKPPQHFHPSVFLIKRTTTESRWGWAFTCTRHLYNATMLFVGNEQKETHARITGSAFIPFDALKPGLDSVCLAFNARSLAVLSAKRKTSFGFSHVYPAHSARDTFSRRKMGL